MWKKAMSTCHTVDLSNCQNLEFFNFQSVKNVEISNCQTVKCAIGDFLCRHPGFQLKRSFLTQNLRYEPLLHWSISNNKTSKRLISIKKHLKCPENLPYAFKWRHIILKRNILTKSGKLIAHSKTMNMNRS